MEITIYQVNMGRDVNRVAFQGLDRLERFQGSKQIESEIYDKVFEGDVDCENLEDAYRMFNVDHPKGYKGRSMSVSDVVELVNEDGTSAFYFCDSIGFKEVEFDPYATEELKEEKIKVVYCEPGKAAREETVGTTLEELQKAVGGDIEAVYPFEEEVCIVCNEEGKFNGMLPNRALRLEDGSIYDVVFGPFFICDCSGQNFGSLNQEQIGKYTKMFFNPERLISVNGSIISVPYQAKEND